MPEFRIDNAPYSEKNEIRKLRPVLSANGRTAGLEITYPENRRNYPYCFVFHITEEEYRNGISPEQLLGARRNPDIIDSRTPHTHTLELTESPVRCVVFSARYEDKSDAYYLTDQRENHVTEPLRLIPTVRCRIAYENIRRGFLGLSASGEKKAILTLGGDLPAPGACLVYCCTGGGRESVKFGIDIRQFRNRTIEFVIKSGETVRLLEPDGQPYLLQVEAPR